MDAYKIDPTVETILKALKLDPKKALWNCHGVLCMYHRTIEKVAADQGIRFAPPLVLEANGVGKSVALCVTGSLDKREEWSIGEASPANCKNAYPYAMAEKRAKDRVVLKLIGLHGLVYSEDEIADDEPAPRAPSPAPASTADKVKALIAQFDQCKDVGAITECWVRLKPNFTELTDAEYHTVRDYAAKLKATFEQEKTA